MGNYVVSLQGEKSCGHIVGNAVIIVKFKGIEHLRFLYGKAVVYC